MPHSVLLLDVHENGIAGELQWPLKELQLAFPDEDIEHTPGTLLERKGAWLERYLHEHMAITDSSGHRWTIVVKNRQVKQSEQSLTGIFYEVVFELWLQPPAGSPDRHFVLHYDAIMHQVVTHKLFISVRQDWDGGVSGKETEDADLGVLTVNPADNRPPPVVINLDEGSKWKGFKNMVNLGIRHIAEGTDHLLFLLVLMLPAPLISSKGKWAHSGGTKYSTIRLLKIATAFTIGHSLTLFAGAVGWLRLPSQPVEVLIALSVFVGALHALRPLFPGREVFIAGGFGLIHGLAFASILGALNVGSLRMALSILGFNIGIELMQLFVLILFMPWLIMLSDYPFYKWVRIAGGIFALVASASWMMERISQRPNAVASFVQATALHAQWIVLIIAATAVGFKLFYKRGVK